MVKVKKNKKLSYFSNKLIRFSFKRKSNIYNLKKNKHESINIYTRSSCIPKNFNKVTFLIHKGNLIKLLKYSKYLNSFKFGEFSFTRKPFYFPLKNKKKKR
uniref:ribosomal protein S19 n=1 Tax=Cryptocaryon irritans TaxID=153251 RepID=UPI0022FDAF31|nr:ribosomal protein S19 [Cryptocaryon irritans]WBP62315.1 ribosomal protein S19 [Cryptocaryon irritans]